ncbi:hypothetical protein MPSEU_000845000 [Mayamaea pseudoterrestris]|nr:hypothetical protein MPSEU_000845000 [Mayamaea pseudoterrestris]
MSDSLECDRVMEDGNDHETDMEADDHSRERVNLTGTPKPFAHAPPLQSMRQQACPILLIVIGLTFAVSFMSHFTLNRQLPAVDTMQQPPRPFIKSRTNRTFTTSYQRTPATNTTIINDENKNCSCFQRQRECCDRKVLRTHKFGYLLTQQLYKSFDPVITRHRIAVSQLPVAAVDNNMDYRHVIIVRNMFDAIVSGFLYHQSGHECWLTFNGDRSRHEKNFDWEKYLQYSHSYPPRRGRSLCRYIAHEHLNISMRVYIDVALSKWYAGVEPYFEEMERRKQAAVDSIPKTWVVCFEDYTNASQQLGLFDESMDFMFPGEGRDDYVIPLQPESYDGGHASSHDPATRQALKQLVYELDEQVFGHALEKLNSLYNCGNQ